MRIRSKAFHARSCEEYYLKVENETKKEESRSLTHSPQERELQNRPRSTGMRGRFSLVAESDRDFQRKQSITQNSPKKTKPNTKATAETKKLLDHYLLESGAFDQLSSIPRSKNHHKKALSPEQHNHSDTHQHHHHHKNEGNNFNNTKKETSETQHTEGDINDDIKIKELQENKDNSENKDAKKSDSSSSSSSSSNGTSSSSDVDDSSSSSDSDGVNRLNQLDGIQFYENEDFSWQTSSPIVLAERTHILILGQSNIGKTELLSDIFSDGHFPPKLNGHQTFDLMVHYLTSKHLLNLWIQNLSIPTFEWIVESVYYKIMKVFIFLFNTSDEHSLFSIETAYETVKKNTLGQSPQCLLIGIHHPEHHHKKTESQIEEIKTKAREFAEKNQFSLFFEHTCLEPIEPSLLTTIKELVHDQLGFIISKKWI